jgi:hypothetical protein
MTTQQFATELERAIGFKGYLLDKYSPDLAEKIKTLNSWYSKIPAAVTANGAFDGVGREAVPSSTQTTRLLATSKDFNEEDAKDLIIEIVENIKFDPDMDPQVSDLEIIQYVGENLFKDWDFMLNVPEIKNRTVTPQERLSVAEGPIWHDIARDKINTKTDESQRDPSSLLRDDKLAIALDALVASKEFGSDGPLIRRMMLEEGATYEELGIDQNDYKRLENAIFGKDGVPGMIDKFDIAVRNSEIDFTKPSGRTDFTPWFIDQVEKDPVAFFGNLVKAPELGEISLVNFFTDGAPDDVGDGFKDVINGWIDESEVGNSDGEGLTGDEKKATMETNREIIKQAQNTLKNYIDADGNITDNAKNAAYDNGMIPETYVATKVYTQVKSNFVPGEDGVSRYEETRTDKKAVFESDALRGSSTKQNNVLKSLLAEDDSFWIANEDGIPMPITDKDVNDSTWASWKHYLIQNGAEATKAFVKPSLQDAVDFHRGELEFTPPGGEVTDEETGQVFTLPALPRRTELAFGLLDDEPPIFDETLFDTEVNRQWGEERPEFAAYLRHQLKTTDFEDRYLKQANPEPMDDRLANLELQQDKLDFYQRRYADAQAAYDVDPTDQNSSSLETAKKDAERADNQYRRETGQSQFDVIPPKEPEPKGTPSALYDPNQYGVSDKLIDDPETTGEPAAYFDYSIDPKTGLPVGYRFVGVDPSTMTEEDKAKAYQRARATSDQMFPQYEEIFGDFPYGKSPTEYKEFLTKTPKSQSEFLTSMIPGFERRYKESDFYKAEQERLKQERAGKDDDEATQKRRQQLRALNTGKTIFTRARR